MAGTVGETIDISTLADGYYHLTAALAGAGSDAAAVTTHEQTVYFLKKSGRVDFLSHAEWAHESKVSEGVLVEEAP